MVGLICEILNFDSRTVVRIDEEACTGCGKCVTICPQMFAMDDSMAVIINHADLKPNEKVCKRAADACALDAIIIE